MGKVVKYFTPENYISNWEDFPPRHDQTIMVVTEYNKKEYCLEKIMVNKYGGFLFDKDVLSYLIKLIHKWEGIVGIKCSIRGKCGERY